MRLSERFYRPIFDCNELKMMAKLNKILDGIKRNSDICNDSMLLDMRSFKQAEQITDPIFNEEKMQRIRSDMSA